jgi:hypothetical protein
MSDHAPVKIDISELVSRLDLTLAYPPADLPQKVPVRFNPDLGIPSIGVRIYVVWRIPGRPGLHGILYCRGIADLEV